ncbi:MAG: ABC transporter permease [Planctomycetes bacterium]|nr:ABC transporter permease [Planctomycetota bacterium]
MAWIEKLLALARNTLLECIRQPVTLVASIIGFLLILLSIPFSAFTMEDDQRMFIDIGLSTIFICGVVLSAFLATGVVSREIENKTVLTVVSKPVPRPIFVLGKYLGVAAVLMLVTLWLGLIFMLTELHGTMPTVATPYHQPVLTFGVAAVLLMFAAGIWCNFLYDWNFGSTIIALGLPLLLLAYGVSLIFKPNWATADIAATFKPNLWKAIGMLMMAELVLGAVAVAVSTRLGQVLTLATVLATFLTGLLSDWLFARKLQQLSDLMSKLPPADQSWHDAVHLEWGLYKALQSVIPNFQIFWLTDALTQKKPIGLEYIATAVPYGVILIAMALAMGTFLFQRREVG